MSLLLRRALAVVLVAALWAGLARPAMAQDRRLDSLFTPAVRADLQAVIGAATRDHRPAEPLVQRALEGGRRGVDGARVVAVVRAFADRMRVARAALGASSSDAELVAGAGVLYLGVDRSVLERMRHAQQGRSVALPLIVMADIIERGVPRDSATAIMLSLGDAKLADADYLMLRQSILLDIGSGASPLAAAATRARGLLAAHSPVKRPP